MRITLDLTIEEVDLLNRLIAYIGTEIPANMIPPGTHLAMKVKEALVEGVK